MPILGSKQRTCHDCVVMTHAEPKRTKASSKGYDNNHIGRAYFCDLTLTSECYYAMKVFSSIFEFIQGKNAQFFQWKGETYWHLQSAKNDLPKQTI